MNLIRGREILSPFFVSVGLGIPGGLLSSRARFRFPRQFEVITFIKKFVNIFALCNCLEGDIINIVDLLTSYDPNQDAIDDFIMFTTSGSNSVVSVDRDGTGTTYTAQDIATITGVTGLDADDLLTNGNLLAAA
ncbi:hypothetical protein DYBT9275_03856 [Dyadobacter sp. CECT 9275]|uniref:Uncharacterized protein n=1 Tax=Dyadobacter helix TaxID=2822344 RepID=A0A916JFN5_9BACT|nr:type I secretion C-terminal target domain-containing protein [Dyadobacter sp. CECT 9275]CAG5006584.1 hypothetical protein DYBT9275_03856 [Dyadobacter sp. CECT 9275]